MQGRSPAVTAYDPDSARALGTGELTFVDNAVDRGSGMIAFKATFPNPDESLWPGQFVDVTVKLAEEPDALVIPATATMEGQQCTQVYVVDGDVASLRKVVMERSVGGLAIIASGLQAGELVVTSGQLRITPGGRVAVKPLPESESNNRNGHH